MSHKIQHVIVESPLYFLKTGGIHYKIRLLKVGEGVTTMCKLMEDLIVDDRKKNTLKMLALGKMSYEEIADCSGLTVEIVAALDEDRTA